MPSYRVKVAATAAIEETWVVDSTVDLDGDQIEAIFQGDDRIAPGTRLRFVGDLVVGDERDREILKVETI